jgi:hypothetical protein
VLPKQGTEARLTSESPLALNCGLPLRRPEDLGVPFLQSVKLLDPLLQRQAADLRNLHRPVKPVGGLAALETKILAGILPTRSMAAFGEPR